MSSEFISVNLDKVGYTAPDNISYYIVSDASIQNIITVMNDAEWTFAKKTVKLPLLTHTDTIEAGTIFNARFNIGIVIVGSINPSNTQMILYNFVNDEFVDSWFARDSRLGICKVNQDTIIFKESNLVIMNAKTESGIDKKLVYGGSFYGFRGRVLDDWIVIEDVKNNRPYMLDKLIKVLVPMVLKSDIEVYTNINSAYMAIYDTEILTEPRILVIDGNEYLGFNYVNSPMMNYYFKIESEE